MHTAPAGALSGGRGTMKTSERTHRVTFRLTPYDLMKLQHLSAGIDPGNLSAAVRKLIAEAPAPATNAAAEAPINRDNHLARSSAA